MKTLLIGLIAETVFLMLTLFIVWFSTAPLKRLIVQPKTKTMHYYELWDNVWIQLLLGLMALVASTMTLDYCLTEGIWENNYKVNSLIVTMIYSYRFLRLWRYKRNPQAYAWHNGPCRCIDFGNLENSSGKKFRSGGLKKDH